MSISVRERRSMSRIERSLAESETKQWAGGQTAGVPAREL
jgi:hypothetical protein